MTKEKVDPLPVVQAAELETTEEEHRWLIETLWMRSAVGLIGGTPKSLKTWVGLEMAVSVASETACLGEFRVSQGGPALLYLAEDRRCTVRERLDALCYHRRLSLETLELHVITVPSLRLDARIDLDRLDATLRQYAPRLLLLDPFVRLHCADENSAQDVATILASLRELQRRHDVAIAVTHHTRKNQRGIRTDKLSEVLVTSTLGPTQLSTSLTKERLCVLPSSTARCPRRDHAMPDSAANLLSSFSYMSTRTSSRASNCRESQYLRSANHSRHAGKVFRCSGGHREGTPEQSRGLPASSRASSPSESLRDP
jgi:hypothetical protein